MIEFLKIQTARTIKRTSKLTKKRLGAHLRGNTNRNEMSEALVATVRKGFCESELPECARAREPQHTKHYFVGKHNLQYLETHWLAYSNSS